MDGLLSLRIWHGLEQGEPGGKKKPAEFAALFGFAGMMQV
jgi:hypothetical protein